MSSSPKDDALLSRYLSGELGGVQSDELLERVIREPALSARLDELRRGTPMRARTIAAAALAVGRSPSSTRDVLEPSVPTAPTPPLYQVGRISGGLQAMMGVGHDQRPRFGPRSIVDLELLATESLDEHVPVLLLLADETGILTPSDLTPSIEEDAVIFQGVAGEIFPRPGPWTLCVLVEADGVADAASGTLEALRRAVPSSRLLTCDVSYVGG